MKDEQERLLPSVKKAAEQVPGVNGEIQVRPVCESKVFLYHVKSGDLELKCRVLAWENREILLHERLQKHVDCVPKLVKVVKFDSPETFKFSEWVPGQNLYEVAGTNEFSFLKDEYFFKWGACVGKIHNVRYGSDRIAIRDVWWHNFVVTPEGKMYFVDMSKLWIQTVPEFDVIRWIGLNTVMVREKKEIWIDGYYSTRTEVSKQLFDVGYMLEKADELIRKPA